MKEGGRIPMEEDRAQREGWSVAGLPLLDFSSDEGFGYGVKVAAFDREEGRKPYNMQVALQVFLSTLHAQHHELYVDAPSLGGGPWRLTTKLQYNYWLLSNYFGTGNTLPDTHAIGNAGDSSSFSTRDRERLSDYYYSFQLTDPRLLINLRRDLAGPFKFFTGLEFERNDITAHTPETIKKFTGLTVDPGWRSFLEETKPYGFGGGDVATLQFGLAHDSRDRETSPARGSFSEFSARIADFSAFSTTEQEVDGSVYGGLNLTDRRFFPITQHLVFATRGVLDLLIGDVPFFDLTSFGGSQDYTGLGGSTSLRGYKLNTLRGKIKALVSPELRYTPIESHPLKGKLDIGFAAFADVGRTWKGYASEGDHPDFHAGAGGGMRFTWNDDFLVRLDVARSSAQGTRLYLEFDNAF